MYTPTKHFADFHIAGFTYWDALDVIHELKLGTELRFEAEPKNPFDPNAVAIYYLNHKLGYIPRGGNQQIFQLLFYGHTNLFEVKVNQIGLEQHPEKQLRVVVKVKDCR